MMSVENLRNEFMKRFGSACNIVRAPGRVNLIGEHTDYNDGFVMPAAIGFFTYVAVAANQSGKLVVHSLQESKTVEFPIAESDPHCLHDWTDYVRGVLIQLRREGFEFSGANLLIEGQVPIGAGLSSSAALEVAIALSLLQLAKRPMEPAEIARLCQRAENEFVGSRCGIMDQFASLLGQPGKALLLDCRSLDVRFLSLPPNVSLVISNTMVKHSIASGEYNVRRVQCEAGVDYFAHHRDGIKALRDVNEEDLREHGSGLSDVLFRRCRHVVTEDKRVLAAADALDSANLAEFGRLMYDSHCSLKNDFEVSCRELDLMVELARAIPGTYGARMTGGGFGGCTINLLEREGVDQFVERIRQGYEQGTGIPPEVYVTEAGTGAGNVN